MNIYYQFVLDPLHVLSLDETIEQIENILSVSERLREPNTNYNEFLDAIGFDGCFDTCVMISAHILRTVSAGRPVEFDVFYDTLVETIGHRFAFLETTFDWDSEKFVGNGADYMNAVAVEIENALNKQEYAFPVDVDMSIDDLLDSIFDN